MHALQYENLEDRAPEMVGVGEGDSSGTGCLPMLLEAFRYFSNCCSPRAGNQPGTSPEYVLKDRSKGSTFRLAAGALGEETHCMLCASSYRLNFLQ